MMRRLVLALLPVAGFALGVGVAVFAAPPIAGGPPLSGAALATGLVGCLLLSTAAAALAAPPRRQPGRPTIPRSAPRDTPRSEPPTLSGYWRAHDEPDWPEGEVRRERASEDEPLAEAP
jgi:hypothetical protein